MSLIIFSFSGNVFAIKNAAPCRTDSMAERQCFLSGDSVLSFRSPKGFIPSLLHDFGEQASAPFKMNSKQVLMVAGGVAVTGALFFADENIDRFFKPLKDKQEWINQSSSQVTEFGARYGIGFVAAFGGYSLLWKDRKAFHTTLLATQAMITSGVWVRFGKMLAGRERPSATYGDFQHDFWWGPFQQFNSRVAKNRSIAAFDAFPSGHTATAFSIASVFAHQYSDKKLVPVLAYTLATIVGISRLTEHEHWASDVFAGACIGYLCGKQVVKHEKELHGAGSASAWKIHPDYFFSFSGNQVLFNCSMVF
ncbi:MAG: phosphatase PAP2 family protein [Bacteroidetes bacterium]|nr:phosphatase PAP2 family protein [Bacteroidota bacterium]